MRSRRRRSAAYAEGSVVSRTDQPGHGSVTVFRSIRASLSEHTAPRRLARPRRRGGDHRRRVSHRVKAGQIILMPGGIPTVKAVERFKMTLFLAITGPAGSVLFLLVVWTRAGHGRDVA